MFPQIRRLNVGSWKPYSRTNPSFKRLRIDIGADAGVIHELFARELCNLIITPTINK